MKSHRKLRSPRAAVLLFSSLIALAPSLRAALVARDDFNGYTPAAALSGLNGGSGWSSAWSSITGVSIAADSLTYTLGSTIIGGGNSLKIAADNNLALGRAVTADTSGRDYFVSFLFRLEGGTAGTPVSGNIFAGWQAQDAIPDITTDNIGYLGLSGKAGARVNGSSDSFGAALNYGETYFFVIKYTGWNGANYTTTQVWVNPTPTDEWTSNALLTQKSTTTTSGTGSSGFTGLRARTLGLSSTAYYLVDELRIGTAWVDVVSPHRNLVVFGDSLSSGGQVSGLPSTGPAPTSTNGGYLKQTWIQQLSPMVGFGTLVDYEHMTANNGLQGGPGGTNYAVGGDTTVDMVGMVTNYLGDVNNTANSGALYVLWCGGNDVGLAVRNAGLTSMRSDAIAAGNAAADRMKAQIIRLVNAGGAQFVWSNLPDLSKTPSVEEYVNLNSGVAEYIARAYVREALHDGSVAFNSRMQTHLTSLISTYPAASFQKMDAWASFEDIIANKADYGFTNVTESSTTNNSYLFYDAVHPTSHGHYEIAHIAYDTVAIGLDEWTFATPVRASLSSFGFSAWGAQGATAAATTYTTTALGSSSTTPRLGVHNVAGAGGATGVLFAHTGSSSTASARNDRFVVAKTLDAPLAIAGRRLALEWSQSFNSTVTKVRVLVRMAGGAWYASAAEYGVTTAGSSGSMTDAERKSLDLAGAAGIGSNQWTQVTFGNGQPIVRGTTAVTPGGSTVTGIGFLVVTESATNRAVFIDDIAIVSGGN